MGLVTVFSALTTTGPGETGIQTAGAVRLGVDCKVNPATFVGHVKMTLPAEAVIDSCGGNEMLNIVPPPRVPPNWVVPYKVLPEKANPLRGKKPSLFGFPSPGYVLKA